MKAQAIESSEVHLTTDNRCAMGSVKAINTQRILCLIWHRISLAIYPSAVQVMGKDNAVGLLKRLRPSVLLPLVNAEFDSEGPLSKLISEKGSVQDTEAALKQQGLGDIRVIVPQAGKPVAVDL